MKSADDCRLLQEDLFKVYDWAEHVNMHFNVNFFECLRFRERPGDAPEHQYMALDNIPIQEKPHLRDLGVEISADLSFSTHIFKMVTAASRLSGWGLRSFKRRGVSVMSTLWKCIIQPGLDYCSQLWTPNFSRTLLEGDVHLVFWGSKERL